MVFLSEPLVAEEGYRRVRHAFRTALVKNEVTTCLLFERHLAMELFQAFRTSCVVLYLDCCLPSQRELLEGNWKLRTFGFCRL